MPWHLEYYEQEDGRQPAEEFEDDLEKKLPKLHGKLIKVLLLLETSGPVTGGGLAEKCDGYPGMWEVRTIFNRRLAPELFGFDRDAIILLHGYVKSSGEKASVQDLDAANRFWRDYQQHHRVSPEVESEDE